MHECVQFHVRVHVRDGISPDSIVKCQLRALHWNCPNQHLVDSSGVQFIRGNRWNYGNTHVEDERTQSQMMKKTSSKRIDEEAINTRMASQSQMCPISDIEPYHNKSCGYSYIRIPKLHTLCRAGPIIVDCKLAGQSHFL